MAAEGNQQIFPGATNTTIHGGIFPAIHGDMHIHKPSSKSYGLEFLIANITQGAFHNAAERGDPPRCHPHTRMAIFKEIVRWLGAPIANRKFILWLYGPVGAGKTALAQTIAEMCEEKGLLAASFFFTRTAVGRNNSLRFVATLAYQLYLSIPEIREPILAAIEEDPTIFSRTLLVQMQVLVVAPLVSFTGPIRLGPRVVVVDGVDESGPNSKVQAELLNVLEAAVSKLQHIPVMFLISSRPDYEIRLAFNTNAFSSLTKVLALDDKYSPNTDIKHYLKSTFQKIQEKQHKLGTPLPSPWPTDHDLNLLVKKSSGQFIFASTVIKFVDSGRHPVKCLNIILGLSDPGKETPFVHLDTLYYHILSSVDDLPKVLEVLTLLMLADTYSNALRVEVVDDLLGLETRRVLMDMHALVFVPPDPDAVLHIYHASLYDFLTDRSRSQDFFVDEKQGHIMIGERWLKLIDSHSHSKCSKGCSLLFEIRAFILQCEKLPGGELADCLAGFDLRALLKKIRDVHDLYGSPWDEFMAACEGQQANNPRFDFFPRLQTQFHDFILDRLSQYPPSLQACIPALFDIGLDPSRAWNLFLVLCHGACRSEAAFLQIQELDSRSLNVANLRPNSYFRTFFENRIKSEQCSGQSSYVALAKEIIRVIRPKPYDTKIHTTVDLEILIPGTTHVFDPLYSFDDILSRTLRNSDLAGFLRERTLQYGYSEKLNQYRRDIAFVSLKYVQECGIPYLRHAHSSDTYECIICEECPDASLCEDADDIVPTSESTPNDSSPYPSSDLESVHSGGVKVIPNHGQDEDEESGQLVTGHSADSANPSVREDSPPRKRQKKD